MQKQNFKLFLFLAILMLPNPTLATTYFEDNFDSYADKAAVNVVWGNIGTSVSLVSPGRDGSGKAMQWIYVGGGFAPTEFDLNIANYNLSEIYVRAYIKFSSNPQGGCKGIKLFGGGYGTLGEYANTTFNFGPVSGPTSISTICNGDGNGLLNDTQVCYNIAGWHEYGGNNYVYNTSTSMFYPDTSWHALEVNMLYNTDDNSNGRTRVWIDGVLRSDVSGIKNRNNGNLRYVERVAFGDYGNPASNFTMWMDDIAISDSYNGLIDSSDVTPPNPPSGLNVL